MYRKEYLLYDIKPAFLSHKPLFGRIEDKMLTILYKVTTPIPTRTSPLTTSPTDIHVKAYTPMFIRMKPYYILSIRRIQRLIQVLSNPRSDDMSTVYSPIAFNSPLLVKFNKVSAYYDKGICIYVYIIKLIFHILAYYGVW